LKFAIQSSFTGQYVETKINTNGRYILAINALWKARSQHHNVKSVQFFKFNLKKINCTSYSTYLCFDEWFTCSFFEEISLAISQDSNQAITELSNLLYDFLGGWGWVVLPIILYRGAMDNILDIPLQCWL
jgi:hypothetical protein